MRRQLMMGAIVAMSAWPCHAIAQTPVTTIINPSFESGTVNTAVGSPWTQIPGLGPMFLANSGSGGDPAVAHSGSNYLTANRQVPEPSRFLHDGA